MMESIECLQGDLFMSTDPRTRQAIQLIRDGKKAEAQTLIDGLLRQYPNDADLWYLAAGAAEGSKRIEHLRRALTVDPHHAKAQAMLNKLAPSMTNLPPIAPVTVKPKSNWPLGLAAVAIILVLIATSGFGGYQLGHDAGLRDSGRTMAFAFYGNEASQTAYPTYIADLDLRQTATVKQAEFAGTAAAVYATNTAVAIQNFRSQTLVAVHATSTGIAIQYIATQTAAAVTVSTPIPDPTIVQSGAWEYSSSQSALDDKESKFLLLNANEKIQNLFTTYLAVACQSSIMRIAMGSEISYESANTVTIRLDKETAKEVSVTVSDDGKVLAFTNSEQMLADLMSHQKLIVAVETFLYGREILTFDIAGLSGAMAPMNKDCGRQ